MSDIRRQLEAARTLIDAALKALETPRVLAADGSPAPATTPVLTDPQGCAHPPARRRGFGGFGAGAATGFRCLECGLTVGA